MFGLPIRVYQFRKTRSFQNNQLSSLFVLFLLVYDLVFLNTNLYLTKTGLFTDNLSTTNSIKKGLTFNLTRK